MERCEGREREGLGGEGGSRGRKGETVGWLWVQRAYCFHGNYCHGEIQIH